MIKKEKMEIKSVKEIALNTMEMILENESISRTAVPGQFLHIAVNGHTLRRPISIADIDKEHSLVTILFKRLGSGTKDLAAYEPGKVLDVLGPSGNGFPVMNESTVLLIGGGIGIPPLYYLGKTLAIQGIKVKSILGFQTKANVFYEQEFKELGDTYIVTDDGSYGEQGFVTNMIPHAQVFDRYYSCGPIPMLKAVKQTLKETPGHISLEERMGCGVGACFACVIPANNEAGYKKICKDGAVFDAREVVL